jgi:hypothetical protein
MPPRLSLEKVKEIFANAGCTLVSSDYQTKDTVLQYKCSCGSKGIHLITYKAFASGQRCSSCTKQRRDNTNIAKYGTSHLASNQEFKEKMLKGFRENQEKRRHKYDDILKFYKNRGCELLSLTYVNNLEKMWYVCKCGKLRLLNFKKFREGAGCLNPKCTKVTYETNNWNSKAIEFLYKKEENKPLFYNEW